MLLPQFSLKRLLALVTLSGFLCVLVAAGYSGQLWAVAVVLAIASVPLMVCAHATVLALIRVAGNLQAHVRGKRAARAAGSPESAN